MFAVKSSRAPSASARRERMVAGRPAPSRRESACSSAWASSAIARSVSSCGSSPRRAALRSSRCSRSIRGVIGSGCDGSVCSPPHSDEVGLEAQRGAVIAMVVRMVIALLFTGVHAVGEGRVQQSLYSLGAAHETSAANEHNGVAGR